MSEEKKVEEGFYSPGSVKKGDISCFECIWIVTMQIIDSPDLEIEWILN
jgi:hypothetical protein